MVLRKGQHDQEITKVCAIQVVLENRKREGYPTCFMRLESFIHESKAR